MKRPYARETTLLIVPVIVLGAGAWWFSRHQPPAKSSGPGQKLVLRPPSTLQAFAGTDLLAGVEIEGNTTFNWKISPWLEIREGAKTQIYRAENSTPALYTKYGFVWCSNLNNREWGLDLEKIPANRSLFFGWDAVEISGATPNVRPRRLRGRQRLDRSKNKPANLHTMARTPQVSVVKCTVVAINANKTVDANMVFLLSGAKDSGKTGLEWDFSEPNGRLVMSGSANGETETDKRRVRQWRIRQPFSTYESPICRVEGRVSAGNRWPLAFRVEPFNVLKVKVGQRLRCVAFPAPFPTPKP